MSWAEIGVAVLALASLGLGASGRVPLDAVGILLVVVLALTGIVPASEAVAGFGNSTVITLAGLYIVSEGLTRTGALEFLVRGSVAKGQQSELGILTTLCLGSFLMSTCISDTAVVLVFLPITIRIARDRGVPVGRFLMPIAYSALFGGTVTLIGSSINLLTSSAAVEAGAKPIEMFDLTPVALPIALVGVGLTILIAHHWLRSHKSLTDLLPEGPSREYVTELVLSNESPLVGRRVGEMIAGLNVRVPFVMHDEDVVMDNVEEHVLTAGDVVMLQGSSDALVATQGKWSTRVIGSSLRAHELHYFEVALSPRSHLIGRQLGDLELQRDFGAVPMAVLRDGRHIRERLLQLTLRPGDMFLLCGDERSIDRVRVSTDFFLVSGSATLVIHRRLAVRALAVISALIAVFILGAVAPKYSIPVPLAALMAATAMVAIGCVRARRAYRSVDWSILVFVVGALALGRAMESTGLAATVARGVVAPLEGFGPLAVLSGLFVVATVLNQFTSPYAVAVLMVPIALEAAARVGVTDPEPFVLAIALAGSNAFATPMGHQVNLIVMGPGGYRYLDYLKLGIPLCIYMAIGVTVLFALRGVH